MIVIVFWIRCEGCLAQFSSQAHTFIDRLERREMEAERAQARKAGWVRRMPTKAKAGDYCPECVVRLGLYKKPGPKPKQALAQ